MTQQAGSLIRRMIGVGFLTATVATVGCSPSPPPLNPARSRPTPGGVREAIIHHVVEGITSQRPKISPSELRDALRLNLRIVASLRQADALWVLFEMPGLSANERYGTALVSLKAERQVLDFGLAIGLNPPQRGSNDLSGVPIALRTAAAGYAAMAGFVDPEIDLVEFLGSPFQVVGSGEPTNGAFIVPMALWGQIRWYEDGNVVGAFPVVSSGLLARQPKKWIVERKGLRTGSSMQYLRGDGATQRHSTIQTLRLRGFYLS